MAGPAHDVDPGGALHLPRQTALIAPIALIAPVVSLAGLAALPAPAHATTAVVVRVNGVQTYGGSGSFAGTVTKSTVTVSGMTCTGLVGGTPIAPTLPAGRYMIDGSTCSGGVLSDPDHVIRRYDGMRYIVKRAPLRVTADDQTREFSDPNPPLTYTVTGFRNGDDASVLSGAPRITTTAKPSSQVRYTYAINIAPGTLAAGRNYLLRPFVSGTFYVTPKTLIVGVKGTQFYGAAAPRFKGYPGVDGLYVRGVRCTRLADGRDISPTLPVKRRLVIDTDSCSGGRLSGRNYRIGGYSSVRFSVFRAPLTLTAEPQTRAYGEANPAFTFTASGFRNGEDASVLTGEPSFTTPADTTSNVGTYPIDLEVGTLAAANYAFTFKDSALTVRRAVLTATADPATREYGAPDPTYTLTYSGFKNDDTAAVLSGAPSFATPATASSNAGVYPLFVSPGTLAADNYAFGSFTGSTLAVAPRSVIVGVTGTQVYGDAAPRFTGDSGVDGVEAGGMTCTKLADGRDISPDLPVASQLDIDPDSCSGGRLSSYNYQVGGYSSERFSVTKAPLTLTAEPQARTYGEANPALTYAVSGFRNGDDASALSGAPALTTPADARSNVGTYPIDLEAGTLAARNYAFTFNDNTLTVTKAVLTATADPATREYSAPDPTFTLGYSGFKNGDTAAVLSGAPSFTTPATVSSNPGVYPLFVNPGTLAAANYTFGPFAGSTLTITQTTGHLVTERMSSSGVLEATLTSGPSRRPVAGATITFYAGIGNSVACTAVTDADGKATCTVTNPGHLTQIERNGYRARYIGGAGVDAVEERQPA